MSSDSPSQDPPPESRPDLDGQLVRHMDTLRCFVRMHCSPELRRREQDSDIVQSVCQEILANRDRFEWQGEPAFRSWLYRAVLDRVRHKLRFHRAGRRDANRAVEADRPGAPVLDSYADLITPSQIAMSHELQSRLEQAIDALPELQREVLARVRLLQQGHDEVAAELGLTVENSRQLLHRAMARLAIVARNG